MTDTSLQTRHPQRRFVTGGALLRKAGTIHAANGVSLSIRHGATFAILGKQGCDRSTLAPLPP